MEIRKLLFLFLTFRLQLPNNVIITPKQYLKNICTPMFIEAVFKRIKTWKQPKHPSTGEWIKMWYTFNKILLSYKNSEIMPFAGT